jgi:cytochrome o ubiquinol oxidase subunit 3
VGGDKMSNDAVIQKAQKEAIEERNDMTQFGFWVYIMTDCVLFASLFATYAVLHNNTFGGPGGHQLFNPGYVLTETLVLLVSSFTCGLGILAANAKNKNAVIAWFLVTALLGLSFLGLEVSEFGRMIAAGNGPDRSGFLSSYFTLVGAHGLHITAGLIWMGVMITQILRVGLTNGTVRRLTLLSLFWHFLDIVWIFIFTIVYMMGVA